MQQPEFISERQRLLPHLYHAATGKPFPRPRHTFPAPVKAGQVYTFGSAVSGELGLGKSTHERRKPGNVKFLNTKDIVAVECGGQHTLALDRQGRVYSWGINDQGALGRITSDDIKPSGGDAMMMDGGESSSEDEDDLKGNEAWVPNQVEIRREDGQAAFVVQMVCADSFSAVLTRDGEVYAWGSFRDPSGVIGFNKQMEKKSQRLPTKIRAFQHKKVVLLGSGENHVFAVTDDDTLWAFGANDENQLGHRSSSRFKNNLEPYEIRGAGGKMKSRLHNIIKIAGGAYHTLYINSHGELYAFGCNNCGQLGLGDVFSHINGPERIEFCIDADGKTRKPLPRIVDIAAGESHSLAVSEDGRLFTFGANLEGQLGYETDKPIYGDDRDHDSPIRAADRKKAGKEEPMDVTPSESQNPSRSTSPTNQLEATPANKLAQQMHESGAANLRGKEDYKLKYQPVPREVARLGEPDGEGGIAPTDHFVMVSAQSRFSLAVTALGRLYTWGSGHCYQLGNEKMEDEVTPFRVQLKTRKCFWARCAGQFTMFLIEPKHEEDGEAQNGNMLTSAAAGGGGSHRNSRSNAGPNGSRRNSSTNQQHFSQPPFNGDAMDFTHYRADPLPSSMPNSPLIARHVPGLLTSPVSNAHMLMSPRAAKDKSSPTVQEALSAFDSVCVSPERKRTRVDSTSTVFTAEQRAAPWSPKKHSGSSGILGSPGLRSPPPASSTRMASKPVRRPRNLLAEIKAANAEDATASRNVASTSRAPLVEKPTMNPAENSPTKPMLGAEKVSHSTRNRASAEEEPVTLPSRTTRSRRQA